MNLSEAALCSHRILTHNLVNRHMQLVNTSDFHFIMQPSQTVERQDWRNAGISKKQNMSDSGLEARKSGILSVA